MYGQGNFPPARSAGMNDCVSRVCVIIGWEWDGIGIGMAIPGGLPVWPEMAIPRMWRFDKKMKVRETIR